MKKVIYQTGSFIRQKIINNKVIAYLLLADLFVLLIFFFWSGIFAVRSDTQFFVLQINNLRGVTDLSDLSGDIHDLVYFRGFKPLYPVVAAYILPSLSPMAVILLINIFFLIGLTIASYYFFRLLDFGERLSFWGSVWIAFGYPVFKYGLALVTDISGWFFCVLTIVIFLNAIKYNKWKLLFLVPIIAFLGSITKETGVVGILFSGLFLCFNYREWGVKETLKKLLIICLPFIFLQIIFMIIMNHIGAPSFVEWYKYNFSIYFHDFYKLRYFITNEFLALNAVFIFSFYGLIEILKKEDLFNNKWFLILVCLLISCLPVLLWPVFYYRVLFIQFIFFVPLALRGISILEQRAKEKGFFGVKYLFFLPPITSVILFLLISKM